MLIMLTMLIIYCYYISIFAQTLQIFSLFLLIIYFAFKSGMLNEYSCRARIGLG